jgi:hypothetical protein
MLHWMLVVAGMLITYMDWNAQNHACVCMCCVCVCVCVCMLSMCVVKAYRALAASLHLQGLLHRQLFSVVLYAGMIHAYTDTRLSCMRTLGVVVEVCL